MTLADYRQRVKHEKRTAALDAAVAAFLERGYSRTTLAQVARAAGVSTGTLFKHFPTKAALFGAIMEQLWQPDSGPDRPCPTPGEPRAGLVAIGHDYARLLRQPTAVPLYRVIIAEAARFPELGQTLHSRGRQPYLIRLQAYLAAEIAVGTLAIEDVELATRQFLGMINDVIFWPRLLLADLVVGDAQVDRVVQGAATTFLARYGAGRPEGRRAAGGG